MSADIQVNNGKFYISGKLNFDTVVKLWDQSLPLFMNHHSLDLDLSKVTESNSAGLSLLVEWLRYADKNKKTITFENLPPQLLSIAKISGVDGLLFRTQLNNN